MANNVPTFGHITETPNPSKRKNYNPGQESDKRRRTVDPGFLRRNQPAPLNFADAPNAVVLEQPALGDPIPVQGAPIPRTRGQRGPDMILLARSDCPFTGNSPPPTNPAAPALRNRGPTELTLARNSFILFDGKNANTDANAGSAIKRVGAIVWMWNHSIEPQFFFTFMKPDNPGKDPGNENIALSKVHMKSAKDQEDRWKRASRKFIYNGVEQLIQLLGGKERFLQFTHAERANIWRTIFSRNGEDIVAGMVDTARQHIDLQGIFRGEQDARRRAWVARFKVIFTQCCCSAINNNFDDFESKDGHLRYYSDFRTFPKAPQLRVLDEWCSDIGDFPVRAGERSDTGRHLTRDTHAPIPEISRRVRF
jgi:hypothetical protein